MFDTSKIGYTFPPVTIDIKRAKIRELALAIGDDNSSTPASKRPRQQATQISPFSPR